MVLRLLRIVGYLAAMTVACVYGFVMLRGPNGLPRMDEQKREIQRLEQTNQSLQREIEDRKRHLDRLANDPAYRQRFQDRAIREHSGKQRKGDVTIYSEPPAR